MKVLDLQCSHEHVFEGWFASEDEFQSQLTRGLVSCPVCADVVITKKLSAPRLNLSGSRSAEATIHSDFVHAPKNLPAVQEVSNMAPAELQAAMLKLVRHVVANTEDVGHKFSEEARKIHYGETEHRNIRGHATPQETEELMEEGIQVMPLPLPEFIKETLQ